MAPQAEAVYRTAVRQRPFSAEFDTHARYDQGMDTLARTLVFAGVAVALFGLLLWGAARLGLGRLPGDIVIERENVRIFFPIVTGLIISIILTLILNIAVRIWR